MEEISNYETLVTTYRIIRNHNPEDQNSNVHLRETVKYGTHDFVLLAHSGPLMLITSFLNSLYFVLNI